MSRVSVAGRTCEQCGGTIGRNRGHESAARRALRRFCSRTCSNGARKLDCPYDLAPLLGAIDVPEYGRGDPTPHAMVILAERASVGRSTVYRWHERGLSEIEADRAAISLRLHPCMIWPEWWELASA